ncbi:MAG: glycosyltransferase [Proteobacteria bacterium]|nr:glycosyltransferase [Pseudomonadota bacterium]
MAERGRVQGGASCRGSQADGPQHVVHVLQWLEVGGGESVALNLGRWQQAQGQRVGVVAFAAGPLASEFERSTIAVQLLGKRAGFDPRLMLRLAALFARTRPEIVHTHDPQSLIYAAPAARCCGARVIHTKHGDTVDSLRQLVLQRLAASTVHRFVAVSPSVAATARRRHEVAPAKLQVVLNGIDTARFRPSAEDRAGLRRELGLPPGARLIVAVGRLEPEKDPELLLRAAAPLVSAGVRLVWIGEGSLADRLRALAVALSPEGWLQLVGLRRDVSRWLAAGDVFALSSRTEGLPLALLEAMAAGLPVVATRVGGVPLALDSEGTGLLVTPGDEAELRRALAQLVDDPVAARRMGAAARATVVARYSLAAMAEAYAAIYRG